MAVDVVWMYLSVFSTAGIHYWTVGQRCAIAGLPVAYFVLEIDVKTNNIIVVSEYFIICASCYQCTIANMLALLPNGTAFSSYR